MTTLVLDVHVETLSPNLGFIPPRKVLTLEMSAKILSMGCLGTLYRAKSVIPMSYRFKMSILGWNGV